MDVIGDLLARERRSGATALLLPDGRERSYREFITNAYKGGNALRHAGVRRGGTLGIAPVADLAPLLGFFGAVQLGAIARFDLAAAATAAPDALLVPVEREAEFDPDPGTTLVAFGGDPASPSTTHWEAVRWSENPAFPPSEVEPDDAALGIGDERFSHRDLLEAAEAVVDRVGMGADDTVVLRASLSEPWAVVAGVLAPLAAGGAVGVAPTDDLGGGPTGTIAVAGADAAADTPEPELVAADDVPL